MKKIVIFPGVGFQNNKEKHNVFIQNLSPFLPDFEFEVFYWQHDWVIPPSKLPYESLRNWLYEVILDFQQVVKHAPSMDVPDADYYIGHSAGSILALVQDRPACVVFGSPASLVECVQTDGEVAPVEISSQLFSAIDLKKAILNIINKYDQLAEYINHDNVENYLYSNSWWNISTYNPYAAHEDYWLNKKIAKLVAERINLWEALDPRG